MNKRQQNNPPDAPDSSEAERDGPLPPPTLWQTWMSVMAAFFGVQTNANRERDSTRGKASHFILLGVLATVLLIATLAGVVKLILVLAGA